MLKLDEIRKILDNETINKTAFARKAGLEYHQLKGILKNKNPRYLSVEKLSDYIEANNLQLFMEKDNPFKKVGE